MDDTNKKGDDRRPHVVEFSKRLHTALDYAGIPPQGQGRNEALREAVGCSQQAASKWTTGRSMPRISTIKTIATWLEVSWRWLYTGRGEMAAESAPANMEPSTGGRLPGYMELGADERLLLAHFRSMDKERKGDILTIVEALAHRASSRENDQGEIDLSEVTPPPPLQTRDEGAQPKHRDTTLRQANGE